MKQMKLVQNPESGGDVDWARGVEESHFATLKEIEALLQQAHRE
jgi:hypothetical protein